MDVVTLCWTGTGVLNRNVPEEWTAVSTHIEGRLTTVDRNNPTSVALYAAEIVERIGTLADDEGKGWVLQSWLAGRGLQDNLVRKVVLWAVPKHLVIKFIKVRLAMPKDVASSFLRFLLNTAELTEIDPMSFLVYMLTSDNAGWDDKTKSQFAKQVQDTRLFAPLVEQWKMSASVANKCNSNGFESIREQIVSITSNENKNVGDAVAVKILQLLPDLLDCYKAFVRVHAEYAEEGTPVPTEAGTAAPVFQIEARVVRFAGIVDKYIAKQSEFFDGTPVGQLLKDSLHAGDTNYNMTYKLGEEVSLMQWRLSLDVLVRNHSSFTPIVPTRLEEFVLGPSASRYFVTDEDKRLATFLVFVFAFGQINGFSASDPGKGSYEHLLQSVGFLVCWKYAKKNIGAVPGIKLTVEIVQAADKYAGMRQRFADMCDYLQDFHSWVPIGTRKSLFVLNEKTQIGPKVATLKGFCSAGGIVGPGYVSENRDCVLAKSGLQMCQYMTMVALIGDEHQKNKMCMHPHRPTAEYDFRVLPDENEQIQGTFRLTTTDRSTFPVAYTARYQLTNVPPDVTTSKNFVANKYAGPIVSADMFRADSAEPRTPSGRTLLWNVTSPFITPDQPTPGFKRRRVMYPSAADATATTLAFDRDA